MSLTVNAHIRSIYAKLGVGDRFFLGDYIAVESTNSKAQMLYTGNGPKAMDVLSIQAGI